MTPEQIAALYEAAEAADDAPLVIATVRALSDPRFADDVRAMLRAPPAAREALSAALRGAARSAPANA